MNEELFQKMAQSVLDGDSDAAAALASQAVAAGVDPLEAITKGFVVGVNTGGRKFRLRSGVSARTGHGRRSHEGRRCHPGT